MEKTIKAILLTTNQVLISQIDEVAASVPGEPDCKLTKPFLIDNGELTPWLTDVSDDEVIMMSSEKILTMVEPNQKLLDEYESLTK